MGLESVMFGRKLKNPMILASGILGMTRASLEAACENGCGAVTAKSLTLEPRKGHEGPNIVEVEDGLLNAMGYPNPGIVAGLKEFGGWKRSEALIISIVGKNKEEFAELAEKVDAAQKTLGATAIEAVMSCPHTPGYGTMAGQGAPECVASITSAIKKKTELPLIIKLSPSVPGEGKAAKAAEDAGADAINMGNSLGPGMVIDIHRKRPFLGFGVGGMSGPAIKPIVIRCVYDVYRSVKIPIIGTGGINSGRDAIEMMMAGATWVSAGSTAYYRGPEAFGQICREMEAWMKSNGVSKLKGMIGAAHD
ncbi:MAG: dihydroorotate dehydrogenase [Candidatus ainarchaeum sp.]|nr:dihydroorotate dehydrogenase [Candidatus ainarchaeum sp.]